MIFYHISFLFTIWKMRKEKADQDSHIPIGLFSYASSLLHSISDPSRNTTNNVPSSNTLIWSSVFSIKSVSISFSGFASFVYSTNFSARYPARRSSPCICCFHCSRKLSRFSTSAFHAIRYAFTSVSSST